MKKNRRDLKECEMVKGTWYKYFYKVADPEFNDEICAKCDELLKTMYGDFFERNFSLNGGKLLSLGAGFGMTEIPLARKGYKIIGLDNDYRILKLLAKNAKKYAKDMVEVIFGDLYENFHQEFIGQNIQACISFGVLEHFNREDLDKLIKKQFEISPLIICMMPTNTPETLKTFKAEKSPEGHIDTNGIYRNFWTPDFWKNEIFKNYNIIDSCHSTNHARFGQIDMITFAIRK